MKLFSYYDFYISYIIVAVIVFGIMYLLYKREKIWLSIIWAFCASLCLLYYKRLLFIFGYSINTSIPLRIPFPLKAILMIIVLYSGIGLILIFTQGLKVFWKKIKTAFELLKRYEDNF